MGTLIPLSPALEGLANGDVATLTDNLRLAFSITVLGLLVGASRSRCRCSATGSTARTSPTSSTSPRSSPPTTGQPSRRSAGTGEEVT